MTNATAAMTNQEVFDLFCRDLHDENADVVIQAMDEDGLPTTDNTGWVDVTVNGVIYEGVEATFKAVSSLIDEINQGAAADIKQARFELAYGI